MNPLIRNVSVAFLLAALSLGTAQANTNNSAPTVVVDTNPVPQMSQRDLDERLWLTALTGNIKAIIDLVEKGANPFISTRHGETAMHAAAARGHLNIVSYLIKQGVSVHARTRTGWTPLHHAARFGHSSVAHFLVKSGASPWVPTSDLSLIHI